jgi:hypothetical protein
MESIIADSLKQMVDDLTSYHGNNHFVKIVDTSTSQVFRLMIQFEPLPHGTYLTIIVQAYIDCPRELCDPFVERVFQEVDKNKDTLLSFEKTNHKVTVVRFICELSNFYQRGTYRCPNCLQSKNYWIINHLESVACYGKVDLDIECQITTVNVVKQTRRLRVWVDSSNTIGELKLLIYHSELNDNAEYAVGDIYTVEKPDGFADSVFVSDIIKGYDSNKADLHCLMGVDDSILM